MTVLIVSMTASHELALISFNVSGQSGTNCINNNSTNSMTQFQKYGHEQSVYAFCAVVRLCTCVQSCSWLLTRPDSEVNYCKFLNENVHLTDRCIFAKRNIIGD